MGKDGEPEVTETRTDGKHGENGREDRRGQ